MFKLRAEGRERANYVEGWRENVWAEWRRAHREKPKKYMLLAVVKADVKLL